MDLKVTNWSLAGLENRAAIPIYLVGQEDQVDEESIMSIRWSTRRVGGQPADFLWSGLSSASITPDMAPLDAAAQTMKSGSTLWANVGVPATCSGVASIDA